MTTDEVDTRLLGWLRLLVDAGAVTGDEAALADTLRERFAAAHPTDKAEATDDRNEGWDVMAAQDEDADEA